MITTSRHIPSPKQTNRLTGDGERLKSEPRMMGVEVAIPLYSFGPAPNTAIVNGMKNVELIKVRFWYIFVSALRAAGFQLSRPLVWLANGIPFVLIAEKVIILKSYS